MEGGVPSGTALASRGDVSNVLALLPSHQEGTRDVCASLVDVAPPEELTGIGVAVAESPDRMVSRFRDALGDTPSELCLVSAGETSRSAAAPNGGDDRRLPMGDGTACRLKTVGSPGNLTDLGVRITECVDDVTRDGRTDDVVLCFDDLSPLLVYRDVRAVFKFVHALTRRTSTAGIFAHLHLDPEAHSPQEVATLKQLFDAIVERTDDGEFVVTTR